MPGAGRRIHRHSRIPDGSGYRDLPGFKITDLLKLRLGSIVDAGWRTGQDIPLCLNGTRIGWVEFDVVSNHLAVRMTELA
jgi:hypothetical protein